MDPVGVVGRGRAGRRGGRAGPPPPGRRRWIAAGRSPREGAGAVSEFTADELAVTLRVPVPTAGRLLGFALELDRLPGTRAALAAGRDRRDPGPGGHHRGGRLSERAARAVEDDGAR